MTKTKQRPLPMPNWLPWLLWMALTPALECPPQLERAWPSWGWLSAGNGQTGRFGEALLEIELVRRGK